MKITKITAGVTIAATLTASMALAHAGATGIVKERMDAMVALRDGVRDVTPMMRGQVEYDETAVEGFAQLLQEHSGEAMTELFPEGSGGMPSRAQNAVWTDWDEFEELAIRLEVLGQALELAAARGPNSGDDAAAVDMMGTGSAMGDQPMMGGMGGTSEPEKLDIDALAALPSDDLFLRVSQTCSACHTKYRAEGN